MAASKTGLVQFTLVIGTFFGLFCWLALLQSRYEDVREKLDTFERQEAVEQARNKRSLGVGEPQTGMTGGATFVRWGRTVCPAESDLVYKGTAGGQHYTQTGGASEYICLPEDPEYAATTSAAEGHAWIYGVELETPAGFSTANSGTSPLVHSDIHCAVCRTKRSTALMIPAKKSCPSGWHLEYWGYLMTGHDGHKASYTYACLDNAPDAGKDSGARDENGGLMYNVQGACGSLPCPPYINNFELTCTVCSK